MVNIVVEEREPAIIWEQNGTAVWLDIQGNVMAQREDRPDLVRISVDDPLATSPIDQSNTAMLDIVRTTLQLQELRPDIPVFRFDQAKGVGFRNENGWDVWLGIGQNMPEKLSIYQTLMANIVARGIQPGEINIVDPDAPYYTVLWGR
jgi:cell division septal protein FtsQ